MSDNSLPSKAIYNLMSEASSSEELAEKVAAYLISTRQTDRLSSVLRGVESVRLKEDNTLEVDVTTARPISQETIGMIKQIFSDNKVVIHHEQDASLLGGIKVRAHDKQLDTSVRTRLQRLKGGN